MYEKLWSTCLTFKKIENYLTEVKYCVIHNDVSFHKPHIYFASTIKFEVHHSYDLNCVQISYIINVSQFGIITSSIIIS